MPPNESLRRGRLWLYWEGQGEQSRKVVPARGKCCLKVVVRADIHEQELDVGGSESGSKLSLTCLSLLTGGAHTV